MKGTPVKQSYFCGLLNFAWAMASVVPGLLKVPSHGVHVEAVR